jgi:hypothetical protein
MNRTTIVALLLLPCAAVAEPLDLRAPTLAATTAFHVLNAIDAGQTIHIADSQHCGTVLAYREVNTMTKRLIGERPSSGSAAAISLAYSVAYHYTARWLQRRTEAAFATNSPRRGLWYTTTVTFHVVGLGAKLVTVVNNHSIGLRVGSSACYKE